MPPGVKGKKDVRIDDLKAAANLQKGIKTLIKNVSRLRRERIVLRNAEAHEKMQTEVGKKLKKKKST